MREKQYNVMKKDTKTLKSWSLSHYFIELKENITHMFGHK